MTENSVIEQGLYCAALIHSMIFNESVQPNASPLAFSIFSHDSENNFFRPQPNPSQITINLLRIAVHAKLHWSLDLIKRFCMECQQAIVSSKYTHPWIVMMVYFIKSFLCKSITEGLPGLMEDVINRTGDRLLTKIWQINRAAWAVVPFIFVLTII